jgi:DNA-directed RNA polymerase specialized sigma24 family protein
MAAMTEQRSSAPPLTAKQQATIRKIARKQGVPARDRDDFVRDVWLEVDRCWTRVPQVEPDTSRYINGMAYHMACDLARKRFSDPTDSPILMSTMSREPSPENGPSLVTVMTASKLFAMAVERDAEGAEWVYRSKVEEEPDAAIAADAGRPVETVRKRIQRLLRWMRDKGTTVLALVFLTICGLEWAAHELRSKPKNDLATAPTTTAVPTGPRDRAAAIRREALAACDAELWAKCADGLDQAATLDPQGEDDARVKAARAAIAQSAPRAPDLGAKPGDKPRP